MLRTPLPPCGLSTPACPPAIATLVPPRAPPSEILLSVTCFGKKVKEREKKGNVERGGKKRVGEGERRPAHLATGWLACPRHQSKRWDDGE